MGIVADLRAWWRWRMRRAGMHMPPFITYRLCGTVVSQEADGWRIEDDEGQTRFAQRYASPQFNLTPDDRVEIEPMVGSWAGARLTNRAWTVLRKLN